jgi:hypothetical protein
MTDFALARRSVAIMQAHWDKHLIAAQAFTRAHGTPEEQHAHYCLDTATHDAATALGTLSDLFGEPVADRIAAAAYRLEKSRRLRTLTP